MITWRARVHEPREHSHHSHIRQNRATEERAGALPGPPATSRGRHLTTTLRITVPGRVAQNRPICMRLSA